MEKGSGRSSSPMWTSNFSSWSKQGACLVPHWVVSAHANTQSSESHCITPNGSLLHQMVITRTIVQCACVCMQVCA